MRATILCYHKVGPFEEEGRKLNIEPERLRSHVRFFARRQAPILRAEELGETWPPGAVCFTFDDAYVSALENATAALEAFGARGTFYAVAGKVAGTSDWDGDLARPLAPLESLLEAQSRGHEIGNHTYRHPHLDRVSPDEQAWEVEEAHRWLTERGLRPGSFCYPYGGQGEAAVAKARELYPVGVVLRKRIAEATDDRLRLPRVVVAYSDSVPMLLYRLYVRPRLRRTPLR
ncbi:MAG: polysaccharide deacetylase family protein [Fimbriimonas sp.]